MLLLILLLATNAAQAVEGPCPIHFVLTTLLKEPNKVLNVTEAYNAAIAEVQKFTYFEKTRISPAAEGVLKHYQEQKIFPLPMIHARDGRVMINAARDRLQEIWPNNFLAKNTELPHLKVEKEMQIYSDNYGIEKGGDSTLVYQGELNGTKVVFRPLTKHNAKACRTTLAGSILNEKLGLHTVTKSKLANVNGKVAVVSEYAQGERLKNLAHFKKISSKSKYDSQAFEFLIGNADVRTENFYVKNEEEFMVFDQGGAFADEILNYFDDDDMFIYGNTLPDHYSKSFAESLKNLDAKTIREMMSSYLTRFEIDGILFRRDIILEDIKRHPELITY